MTAPADVAVRKLDPISLEVLRSRLDAVAEDAASTIARTAVSPVITESHDFGVSLLDGDGNLVSGGGWVSIHRVAATRAVRATIERYGDTIARGDVFLANDPYNGGGLHANDVFVERPIFVRDRRVAWVVLSAHMLDMGGMAPGSFAPAATECFQEAFRVPPVRLFRAGDEVSEVWDIFRTNVRMAPLIEMDLRGLVAGAHVADEKVAELAESTGCDLFVEGMRELEMLSEKELRKRIAAIADGVYRVTTWNEWEDELYEIPCALTIAGDRLLFDFEGAAPQAPHYFNCQPYIVKSLFMMWFRPLIAPDLPFTEGLLDPIELSCPEGSILNAVSPAPMNSGHAHGAYIAAEAMLQCLRMALWATHPAVPASRFVHGWGGAPASSVSTWAGADIDDRPVTWALVEGGWVGGTATVVGDGQDFASFVVGPETPASTPDVEVLELWYPMLVTERRVRPGVNGAGAHRSGGGSQVKVRPHHTTHLEGQMLGIREQLPLEGSAGGLPGSTGLLLVHRRDGTVDEISNKAAGVRLENGETFEVRCASGGGFGDPVDRDPRDVAADVTDGGITDADAAAVYGVVLDGGGEPDLAATAVRRSELLAGRLARASEPARRLTDDQVDGLIDGEPIPLYPGVVHRGPVALATESSAPLAVAPDHWTEGCPVLEDRWRGPGRDVIVRMYLDPRTGKSLYVEAVPDGQPRSFEISPAHWTRAGA